MVVQPILAKTSLVFTPIVRSFAQTQMHACMACNLYAGRHDDGEDEGYRADAHDDAAAASGCSKLLLTWARCSATFVQAGAL